MDFPTRRLMALDRTNAKIASASGDERKSLEAKQAETNERIARMLLEGGTEWPDDDPDEVYDTGGRYIVPFFEVKGHPSKKGLPMAHEWMRERNCEWDGSTKSLRAEIVRALLRGETVPKFGLAIRLTLQIRKD
ncbi:MULTISPECIES: hypothetical protein [unclassified Bradyrhizobium]|uniref:hypothetical protein n=1 Tax=unclassified Bradyrhizobium TaxID=2631580 RepID=UPI003390AE87